MFPCPEAKTLQDMALTSNSSFVTMVNGVTVSQTDSGLHTPRPDQNLHMQGVYPDMSATSTLADLQTIWSNAYFQTPGPSPGLQSSNTYAYLQTVPMYQSLGQDFNMGKHLL